MPVALAVNGGSSGVKCALFTFDREPVLVQRGAVEGPADVAVRQILAWAAAHTDPSSLAAIGHRVVHGGDHYTMPQRITPDVLEVLGTLIPFAPNHLPEEVALIDAFGRHAPGVPQVACFDTAFHASLPDVARRLPIPAEYHARGVRRYGFHGLSYSYLVEQTRRLSAAEGRPFPARLVLAHLGSGSSLAAILDGRSIDTTMGFTPLGGVVMSTRSGDLDPGAVTYMARTSGLSADALEEMLSQRSGLRGISDRTGDMRELLDLAGQDAGARLAVDSFVQSVRKNIGALAAVLGGLDTLVFSGGIGEHAASIRAAVGEGLAFFGVAIDRDRNEAHAPLISSGDSRVRVRVIPTNEELEIARAAHALLNKEEHHAD